MLNLNEIIKTWFKFCRFEDKIMEGVKRASQSASGEIKQWPESKKKIINLFEEVEPNQRN